MRKVYEIVPESGSHVLYENQVPIARFNILTAAEATREQFVQEYAKELERKLEQPIEMEI